MIKAMMGETLIIGISEGNVDLIKKDRPIKIDFSEMGIVGRPIKEIIIFYGKTDQDIFNQMKPNIDPLKTKFNSDQSHNN